MQDIIERRHAGGNVGTPSLATKLTVKALVAAVVLGGLISVAYTKLESEPWPALMMPRFGGVPEQLPYNFLTMDIEALTQTGEVITIDREDLLADLPVSLHKGVLNKFSPRRGPASPELQAWLRTRLAEMHPDVAIAAVHFNWYRVSRLAPAGDSAPSTEELDTYVVDIR